jgi:hypothetical protein
MVPPAPTPGRSTALRPLRKWVCGTRDSAAANEKATPENARLAQEAFAKRQPETSLCPAGTNPLGTIKITLTGAELAAIESLSADLVEPDREHSKLTRYALKAELIAARAAAARKPNMIMDLERMGNVDEMFQRSGQRRRAWKERALTLRGDFGRTVGLQVGKQLAPVFFTALSEREGKERAEAAELNVVLTPSPLLTELRTALTRLERSIARNHVSLEEMSVCSPVRPAG